MSKGKRKWSKKKRTAKYGKKRKSSMKKYRKKSPRK